MQTVPVERFTAWGEAADESKSSVTGGSRGRSPSQMKEAEITRGVSCENCHGPAENWLLSHTRPDYTHADRVNAGMRDLKNLYVRANTCVACHQNVDNDILAAGHPELIFELDGQAVTMPKHWRETTNWNGAQAWFVGQSVALREMSWQQAPEQSLTKNENEKNAWFGLFFSVAAASLADDNQLSVDRDGSGYRHSLLSGQNWSDQLARNATIKEWPIALTRNCLNSLAKIDFADSKDSHAFFARRAERLVLALDRLVAALPELDKNEPVQAALKQLFKDAQSLPDFNPAQFADHLEKFRLALPSGLAK